MIHPQRMLSRKIKKFRNHFLLQNLLSDFHFNHDIFSKRIGGFLTYPRFQPYACTAPLPHRKIGKKSVEDIHCHSIPFSGFSELARTLSNWIFPIIPVELSFAYKPAVFIAPIGKIPALFRKSSQPDEILIQFVFLKKEVIIFLSSVSISPWASITQTGGRQCSHRLLRLASFAPCSIQIQSTPFMGCPEIEISRKFRTNDNHQYRQHILVLLVWPSIFQLFHRW